MCFLHPGNFNSGFTFLQALNKVYFYKHHIQITCIFKKSDCYTLNKNIKSIKLRIKLHFYTMYITYYFIHTDYSDQ